MYEFRNYLGKQVLEEDTSVLEEMRAVADSYDFLAEEDVLQYLDENAHICCFYKDEQLLGFSWLDFNEPERISELCWFVMDKNKSKGIEGKLLLDKTIEYCKEKGITSLKFNCADVSWGRIKNSHELFKKFGYSLSEDYDYDMSIDV